MVGFMVRNLILSGWAFFPLPYFGLKFKWQVPLNALKSINSTIVAFARLPGPNYLSSLNTNFWGWFINWFNNNKNNFSLNSLLFLFPLMFVYLYSRPKFKKQFNLLINIGKVDFLIFGNVATVLFVFLTSPDLRYMSIYIFVAVSLILSSYFADFLINVQFKNVIVLVFVFLVSNNLFKAINLKEKPELFKIQKEGSSLVEQFIISYPDQSFYVWKPVDGDQCGNSPLPCTPNPNGYGKIKLFQPGDVGDGFYLVK
jgi:hypothetical protein